MFLNYFKIITIWKPIILGLSCNFYGCVLLCCSFSLFYHSGDMVFLSCIVMQFWLYSSGNIPFATLVFSFYCSGNFPYLSPLTSLYFSLDILYHNYFSIAYVFGNNRHRLLFYFDPPHIYCNKSLCVVLLILPPFYSIHFCLRKDNFLIIQYMGPLLRILKPNTCFFTSLLYFLYLLL